MCKFGDKVQLYDMPHKSIFKDENEEIYYMRLEDENSNKSLYRCFNLTTGAFIYLDCLKSFEFLGTDIEDALDNQWHEGYWNG